MTINGDVKNDVFWTFNMVPEFASYVSFFFLPPASVCMWGVGGDMMESWEGWSINLIYTIKAVTPSSMLIYSKHLTISETREKHGNILITMKCINKILMI